MAPGPKAVLLTASFIALLAVSATLTGALANGEIHNVTYSTEAVDCSATCVTSFSTASSCRSRSPGLSGPTCSTSSSPNSARSTCTRGCG